MSSWQIFSDRSADYRTEPLRVYRESKRGDRTIRERPHFRMLGDLTNDSVICGSRMHAVRWLPSLDPWPTIQSMVRGFRQANRKHETSVLKCFQQAVLETKLKGVTALTGLHDDLLSAGAPAPLPSSPPGH
jgi:hypothetical protein